MSVGAVNMVQPQVQPRKTGGAGKAVASAFVPGLGQFMDNRNAAGAGFLGGAVALNVGSYIFNGKTAKMAGENLAKGLPILSNIPKARLVGLVGTLVAATALSIANIVDAYKGDRTNKA